MTLHKGWQVHCTSVSRCSSSVLAGTLHKGLYHGRKTLGIGCMAHNAQIAHSVSQGCRLMHQ